jgi:putative addiction module killer protein
MRVHVGQGYRVYFAQRERRVVLLLCGGDKSSQARDIRRAQQILAELDEE